MRTITSIALAATLLALPACDSRPSAISSDLALVEPGITGDWLTPAGDIVRIDGGWPSSDYTLRVSTADNNDTLPMRIATFGGTRIMEVAVNAPSDDEPAVYHYSKISIAPNQLTAEPLKPEWLRARSDDRITAMTTDDGKFVAAVDDPGEMRELLRQAALDDRAWLPAERLTRVNSR